MLGVVLSHRRLIYKLGNGEKNWKNVIQGPIMEDFVCHTAEFCLAGNERLENFKLMTLQQFCCKNILMAMVEDSLRKVRSVIQTN